MSSLQFQLANGLNLFFLIFATLWTCHGAVRDTLKPGDTLDSTSFLVSAKAMFTLGFFANQNSNSSYLAIWQTGNPVRLWIANRSAPILYPSGVLTLDMNKTLKIMHKGGDPVVLYPANSETTSINSTSTVVATLLDSGNFIMQELNSDGSMKRVLWESFDHLGDTLLPGMKVGVNRRNGHIWSVSSWSSFYVPAPGPFTLDWDPNGRELKIKRRGVVYWTSGVFRDGRFEFMKPDDEFRRLRYKFSIVSNENEDYFTYTSANVDQNYRPEWVLGLFGRLFEVGGNVIAPADNCYAYNTDGGCQRRDYPSCRHFGDTFVEKNGFFNPTTPNLAVKKDPNTSLSISDCGEACWEDCDCLGFNFLLDNQTGCQFWIGKWDFVHQFGYPTTIYILSELSRNDTISADKTSKESDTNRWIWIEEENLTFQGKARKMIVNELLDHNAGKMGHNDLRVYSYASVLAATSNFSEENKLGEGGFGPVYRGRSVTGQDIAVKRLSRCSGQGTVEFKNELTLISELQHTNLVQLLGFCIHGEERMLIYEYMPNKSLDYFLFDSTRRMLLDWNKRFRLLEHMVTCLLRKTTAFYNDDRVLNVVGYAWELWKDGRGLELMDPTLSDSCIKDQLLRCIHVGLLCVEGNAIDRPTISDVISMLTNERLSLPAPTKPAFCVGRKVVRGGIDGKRSEIISVNSMSNSEFQAR
ncbi:hypothetical protein M0R45_014238 [Rubus argutus]|uniref:Receptor-like serine/threonine-protein kinase n=1 Tax=Rubus argutus TaxID=59490 RepID=A0AAW1XKW0_RUBAR